MATLEVPLIPISFMVFPDLLGVIELSDRDLASLLYEEYLKGKRYAGVFLKKVDSDQREIVSSVSDVYGVGTLVEIQGFQYQNEKWRLGVKGCRRISLKGILPWSSDGCPQSEPQPANHNIGEHIVYTHNYSEGQESTASTSEVIPLKKTSNGDEKFLMAKVEILNDENDAKPEELEAIYQDIKKIINDPDLCLRLEVPGNYPYDIRVYELALWTLADNHKKQEVLEVEKSERRWRLLSLLLMKQKLKHLEAQHIEGLKLLSEYKIIHDESDDIQKNEATPKAVRDAIKKVKNKGARKYKKYIECKNYLKMVTSLPWNVLSQENTDVERAKRILDADLIGLEDVKMRILGAHGMTLIIHGPPGAGKKSIGKAIARALNRKWAIVDMECMVDVTDLLGKEWADVGGKPGKIVESLKETGTMNPVLLLNGVDIAWTEKRNFICDALINLLHLATKSSFHDRYLGFKVDLSKVLFVWIASDISSIPAYLHNNLYVIEVTGYFLHEKLEIAKKCLIPAVQLLIDDSAIKKLVLEYCQELGVNHLKRLIEGITREKNDAISKGQDKFMTVNKENVETYLQESKRHRVHETRSVELVRGLAYDHKSSSAMYIRVLKFSGENANICTGYLDTTFKESVDKAVSYVKYKIPELNKSWFHIDVPPGDTPKYGTSAGLAIVTAIMLWIHEKPVPPKMAMTGEVTIHGDVLPVSGIRQKMIAAEKEGVEHIFLPRGNENDYKKLPEHFKKGRKAYFVDQYEEVFPILNKLLALCKFN